jgi:HrpA-like RNA helicase
MENMLNARAELAVAALKRQDGNVIVFLPGLQEILTTQEKVIALMAGSLEVDTVILHSEMLGACDDQPKTLSGRTNKYNVLVLASSIAARSITLPDMRYVFIHPHTRVPVLHESGITILMDERVDPELEANMAGRVGRTCDGVVTYLFNIDDS